MTAKVTLMIDADLVETAKRYAKKNGRSLSALVENYLKTLPIHKDESRQKYSPVIQELLGSVPLPKDFNYKEELDSELTKKYLSI